MSKVNENFYFCKILGLHRDGSNGEPVVTKVYKPKFDLKSWDFEDDGFRIEDFPNIGLFDVIDGQQAEKKIYFEDDITYASLDSSASFTGFIDKLNTIDDILFTTKEYVWLENEVVFIEQINDLGDRWEIVLQRSKNNTIPITDGFIYKGFFGTNPKCYWSKRTIGYFAKEEKVRWENTYKLQRNKVNPLGLTVELRDYHTGSLEYIGVIESLNITEGTMVIDCKSITTAFDIEIPSYMIKELLFPPYITIDNLLRLCLGYHFSSRLTKGYTPKGYFTLDKVKTETFNLLGNLASEIMFYIDYPSFERMLSFVPRFAIDGFTEDNEDTIKMSDLLRFVSFITGHIITQENGLISFINVYAPQNAMENPTTLYRDLSKDLISPKTVTERFPYVGNITINTTNGKLIYMFPDGAGLKSDNGISFDLDLKVDKALKEIIFESVSNYSKIFRYILSILKVEIPEQLSEMDYRVGTKFFIQDISNFETFQKKGSEEFTTAIVLNREADEVEIGITAGQVYFPVAPCWELEFASQTEEKQAKYTIKNLDEFLLEAGDLHITTPYIYEDSFGNKTFIEVGTEEDEKIYRAYDSDWVKINAFIGSIVLNNDTGLEIILDFSAVIDFESVKFLLWDRKTSTNRDFNSFFFELGVTEWR